MKKKTIIAMVAIALVLVCAIGGTVAWLVDSTGEVKNTFTFGDINITLEETTGVATEEGRDFKVYPGAVVEKDPTVTVKANSEACWLFVKVEESDKYNALTYEIATGWTKLSDVAGVYYREVDANAEDDQDFAVLAGNEVTVSNTLTKAVVTADDFAPELTFTAYAVQKDGIGSATEAWAKVG